MIDASKLPRVPNQILQEEQQPVLEYTRAPLAPEGQPGGCRPPDDTGNHPMSLKRIGAPAALAVSLRAARDQARVDTDAAGNSALDEEIRQQVEQWTKDAETRTGRSLVQQTYRLTLDCFGAAIRLARPPVLAVAHIRFYDSGGVQRTLDPQDYLLDAQSEPGCIVPAPGRAWPVTQQRLNAVEVQYSAGYGPDSASVPADIRGYILGRVARHFAPSAAPDSALLDRLLEGEKVHA